MDDPTTILPTKADPSASAINLESATATSLTFTQALQATEVDAAVSDFDN